MDETFANPRKMKKLIKSYPDFPKKGILFKDLLGILREPSEFKKLIENMSSKEIIKKADALIAIDARGFVFGSAIAFLTSKPMVVARKPGKLPGKLKTKSYDLEYGTNSLSIQEESLDGFQKIAIVDDLLATGGTVNCVSEILESMGKDITGLSVVIELEALEGRSKFDFDISSEMKF